ncbi:MAG TPA: GlsB/YeaQ/YmgE family stress response membrane protein, partial [Candidatus Aquilonibacter sp.]|nr:GlsB/YeaQ/YmgE family stress response membrane protein [Candidatus Aquilonibacter sp.]
GERAGNRRNMAILLWIVFGLIAGAIAKYIVGGGPSGVVGDIVVGIVGAVIGGYVYGLFGHPGITGFDLWSLVCAIVGAILLLVVLRALRRPAY